MFDTPLAIVTTVIGWLATIVTILCYIPQVIKTFITKDTSGVSKWFFILGLSSAFFWIILGVLGIINASIMGYNLEESLIANIPIIATNIFGVFANAVVIFYKVRNIINAKKENLSEIEYCLKYIESNNKKIPKILEGL